MSVPSGGGRGAAASASAAPAAEEADAENEAEAEPPLPLPAAAAAQPLLEGSESFLDRESSPELRPSLMAHRAGKGRADRVVEAGGGATCWGFEREGEGGRRCQASSPSGQSELELRPLSSSETFFLSPLFSPGTSESQLQLAASK